MSGISYESPSVHSYLQILQSAISRMASNSISCKTWCIALVSAILISVPHEDLTSNDNRILIAAIPIVLFFFLDSYYLVMERGLRAKYDEFVEKIHSGSATLDAG